ncbi:MAG: hypothetical protein JWL62_3748, partial [Hyphomicrobiales bacterium]|nr:hypothetical protein [Hyphomicrobiales bacterium]
QTGLQSEVNAGQFSGDTLGHVQTVLSDMMTAMSAATASVNGGGSFGSVSAAEEALRTSHLDILDIVHNDATLSALSTQNGATGFQAAPAPFADGVTAANAPHANLADIGAIFNDAVSHSLGGINADNAALITADINAASSGLQSLIEQNPTLFGGLTGVHADTIVRQLELEKIYINQAGVSPDAARGTNDNLLDITDIVQGDGNLANMASQNGVTGFTALPDALAATPKYIDNASQTDFWANFIAQSNSLGQNAIQVVGTDDTAATDALVGKLHAFETRVTNFDSSQGGIFEARFDNELLGNTSTLGAEVTKMIEGLHTGNAALVAAAADEMHANAADVGGNNIPVAGGTYNPDGLTAADVLSGATTAIATAAASTPAVVAAADTTVDATLKQGVSAVTAPVDTPVDTPVVAGATTTQPAKAAPAPTPAADVTTADITVDHHQMPHVHVDHHMWG